MRDARWETPRVTERISENNTPKRETRIPLQSDKLYFFIIEYSGGCLGSIGVRVLYSETVLVVTHKDNH